jgi:predicted DNA-binding transcriptional regulator AlpA
MTETQEKVTGRYAGANIQVVREKLTFTKAEVSEVLGGISAKTLDRLIKLGHFPRPIKLGRGTPPIWAVSTIRAWLEVFPLLKDGHEHLGDEADE